MALRSWRRLHGASIIAQVDPDPLGAWHATAWNAKPPSAEPFTLRHRYRLLTSAQAAADHAARRRFHHKCDVGTCGVWLPWEGEKASER